jgi:molybdate transport system ATP-binding protein
MKEIQHGAIHISDKVDKEYIIEDIMNGNLFKDYINLGSLNGELFSTIALGHFIDEELRHEHFELIEGSNRNLNSFSDGEQKKALLSYIISKKPGYIILDNIFDSLDKSSQTAILATLQEISNATIIIQIANRKTDILPFIKTVYVLDNNKIISEHAINDYLRQPVHEEIFSLASPIPPALIERVPEKNPLVKFNNVSVNYDGRKILNNISWQVNAGEFWQLMGPNGSGKSTILSMITGNNTKAYGEDIFLFGHKKGSGESIWQIKEKIGYFSSAVTQQFSRLHSIEQMVISGFFDSIGLYTKPSDRQIQLAAEWLNLVGMYKQRKKPFLSLSPGHQRLIMIIRAMIKHPSLLILDEPTAGLDDYDVSVFTTLANKISQESATAIIYVSHRAEIGLSPQFIYELIPGVDGSTGQVQSH